MSKIDVKKSFTTPLLRELNTNKETRERIEGQKGQLLILNNANAFKVVVEASTGLTVSNLLLRRALRAGRARAISLQKTFESSKKGKNRVATIKRRLERDGILQSQKLKMGQSLFVVTNFESSLKSIKDIMLDIIFQGLGIEDSAVKTDVSSRIQKGHGEEGYSVSQVQIAKTIGRASQQVGGADFLKTNFDTFLQKASINEETRAEYLNQVQSLSVQYSNMVTRSGRLKAQYFSIITFQDQGSNAEDGRMEKKLVSLFRKFINTTYGTALIDTKGSSTIRQKVASHVVHSLTDQIGKKVGVKILIDPSLPVKGSKSTGSTETKAKKEKRSSLNRASKRALKKPKKTKARKSFTSNPLAMIAMINKELPDTVRKNMQLPGLENRSGRFSEGVKVTSVLKTSRGYPSIGYTYAKYPYQTFEPGYAQGSTERDPRKVINQSIREIAAQFALGRFYTRRE
tara:strand:+ start:1830 stop:3200 length:1371 start_codon:yes stop_codon:yes gene_type:complete